jgi:FkbM family methyltransferase
MAESFRCCWQGGRGIYGKQEWGVQRDDIVLDVGACIGTWTRQALDRGARLVIAIEPTPSSVECLKRNLAREIAGGQVVVYPKGIWDLEGALTLFGNNSTGSETASSTITVRPIVSMPFR